MPRRRGHTIVFAPETLGHLDAIESRHHSLIKKAIIEQLTNTPTEQTQNRKPLRRAASFGADWEIRCGPNNRFRVYYEVENDSQFVRVLAIGVKVRNRLLIGGEEIEL